MLRVAILVNRHDQFHRIRYWMRAIAELWEEKGIEVSVLCGPQMRAKADVAILHVNLTAIPWTYRAFIRQFPVVINGGVTNIAKRAVSTNLVRRGDGYAGPVIVKTDRNHGGLPEERTAQAIWQSKRPQEILANAGLLLGEAHRATSRRWRTGRTERLQGYEIFDTPEDVPDSFWKDRELVVERFLPERREGGLYCVRTWVFLGDRERSTLFYADDPLVKAENIVGYEPVEVPDAIRQRRAELKFDFGKFDYTIADGTPVLFDANRTPGIGSFPKERYLPIVQTLAEGLDSFL